LKNIFHLINMMHTCFNIKIQNELFYNEIEEFLNVKKLKGNLLSFNVTFLENPFIFTLNSLEFSEPNKKQNLEIKENGRKRKTGGIF